MIEAYFLLKDVNVLKQGDIVIELIIFLGIKKYPEAITPGYIHYINNKLYQINATLNKFS